MEPTIDSIIDQKKESFKTLAEKLSVLQTQDITQQITTSYTLDLSWNEQMYYAKLGLAKLHYDISRYQKKYGQDD